MPSKIVGVAGLLLVLMSIGLAVYGAITGSIFDNNFFTHGMLMVIYSEIQND